MTLRVQSALDDPDIPVARVATLIQAEPVLAAKVVAVANSVAFNPSGRAIADVRGAVARLGFRTLRSLAMAQLVRQLGAGKGNISPQRRQMATQLWEHTAHVTALAYLLASRVTRVDAELALFAAIVHEIGGFYLLSRAGEFPQLLEGDRSEWNEDDVIALEADIGRSVLRALAIPEPAMAALETYWEGYLAMPPCSVGDTLILAVDLAPVASPFHDPTACAQASSAGVGAAAASRASSGAASPAGASAAGPSASGAAATIEILVGKETLSAILKESAEDVASLVAALKL